MVTAIAKLDWKICLIYLDYRKYQTCNVVITTDDKKIDLTKQTLGRHQLIFAFLWCSFFGKQSKTSNERNTIMHIPYVVFPVRYNLHCEGGCQVRKTKAEIKDVVFNEPQKKRQRQRATAYYYSLGYRLTREIYRLDQSRRRRGGMFCFPYVF